MQAKVGGLEGVKNKSKKFPGEAMPEEPPETLWNRTVLIPDPQLNLETEGQYNSKGPQGFLTTPKGNAINHEEGVGRGFNYINIINHIIYLLKIIDLFGIPLQWANTKKWGWDSCGQIHTEQSILPLQASSHIFFVLVHRKVGKVYYPVEDAGNPLQFVVTEKKVKKRMFPHWMIPLQKSPTCAL